MTRLPIPHALAGALLALVSVVPARAQEKAPFRYETQHVDDYFAQRAAALAAALGFATWPSTPGLFPPPAVSRTLLRDPAAPLDEVRACTTVAFNDGAWPQCTWSWKGRSEGRKPASQDWLDLEVTTTPSSRGAREYLIGALVANQLPTEAVVQRYTSAERPANLGDVSFVVRSPKGDETSVAFLRANLVFRIRGHGALADEALPLAVRLDEGLLGQPPLTPEELRARSRDPLRRR